MAPKTIPEGYHSTSPALDRRRGGGERLLQRASPRRSATACRPGGKIAHAELAIGDSVVMLSDSFRTRRSRRPRSSGDDVGIFVYVEDVDGAAGTRPAGLGRTTTVPVTSASSIAGPDLPPMSVAHAVELDPGVLHDLVQAVQVALASPSWLLR